MRRIAFWGNFGSGNLGNECTLQALVHNARRHLPAVELICVGSVPDDVASRHGLPAIPISPTRGTPGARRAGALAARPLRLARRLMVESYDWVRALRTARRTDMFVMSGTGMLSDTGEGVFGLPYEIFKWSLAAKACGRRLLFVSVGVESIRHPLARCFIRTALRVADYRCYRDVQSRDRLRTLGFAVDADPVHPDLAFSLPESLTEVPQRPAAGRPTVAVGLYDYLGRGRGGVAEAGAYRDYVAKICAFVVWLLDHAYRVRLIIGDLSYDVAVLADVKEQLAVRGVVAPGDRLVDRPATSVEQLLRHLSEVDLVVATRFHNVLLGLLLGKPAISISYHAKNDALMAEMGLARYCQPIAQLDLERLITQFRELEARATQLRPGILDKARSYRDELERQYRRIFADA